NRFVSQKSDEFQGVIRKPRAAAGFRGTVRYAPISCHMQRELCRKDDVETWIYQQVELTVGRVPWREVQDMNQVGEYKKRCRQPPGLYELFAPPCPREFVEILQMVDALKYYDAPNYQQIYAVTMFFQCSSDVRLLTVMNEHFEEHSRHIYLGIFKKSM
ncbi:hypothetical protein ANCCAN_16059, partial [Ancylostoma caninum]